MEENPGHQSISRGSNPIDVGEWSAQVYIGPTEQFFTAIVAHDHVAVALMINERIDVNRRDHVGRTALHVAILVRDTVIVCDLINAGARMTVRLADGKMMLHLAVQMDLGEVVRKMLERSAADAEAVKKAEEMAAKDKQKVGDGGDNGDEDGDKDMEESDVERPSSEDDWLSEDSDNHPKKASAVPTSTQPADSSDLPEDDAEAPYVLDVNFTVPTSW
jgi:ankyrin repeat protein